MYKRICLTLSLVRALGRQGAAGLRRPVRWRLAAAVCALACSGLAAAPPHPPVDASLRGTLLVAAPGSIGPFAQTVVLVIEHGRAGALGLVVNLPTDDGLEDVLPEQIQSPQQDYRLFSGGPVQQQQLSIVLRGDQGSEDLVQVTSELRYTRLTAAFDRIIAAAPPRTHIRVFAGYTGWGPGQLEWEIHRGAWLITAADAETILESDPTSLWRRMLKRILGDNPGLPQLRPQGVI